MAQVKRTKDGRWLLDFEDQYCKRHRIKMKPGATKNDAVQELGKRVAEVAKGTFVSAKKVPTFKQIANDWLKHKKLQIGIDAWGNHERNIRLHLARFHEVKITRVISSMLQEFMDDRLEAGVHRETLRKIKSTMNQILDYAVLHRYLNNNPLGPVKILVQRRESGDGKEDLPEKKMQILNPGQVKVLLDAEEDPKYHCLFMLAVFSGAVFLNDSLLNFFFGILS